MKHFQITFQGRKLGAQGIFYSIMESITAETKEEAILKLYQKYDLLMSPHSIIEVRKPVKGEIQL